MQNNMKILWILTNISAFVSGCGESEKANVSHLIQPYINTEFNMGEEYFT